MAQLQPSELFGLEYNYRGLPYCEVALTPVEYGTDNSGGLPFYALVFAPLNVYIKISGAWKRASGLYYNNNGTWKTITSISKKVDGVWVD